MASSSSSTAPKLIVPEERSTIDTNEIQKSSTSTTLPFTETTPSRGNATRKLTKYLSIQSSFERRYPPRQITKRFSIDADPSSIILNTHYPTDLSSSSLQHQLSISDADDYSPNYTSNNTHGKETSPARSPSLIKSDSFLEIPYEKGEIVDLIKLADDPNAATHITCDGQEVLLEHAVAPHDATESEKNASREARDAFIFNRLLPGVYFAFITACGLIGGFGFAIGRTKKRETTTKLTQQPNAKVLFDDGHVLAVRALRRASVYSAAGVFSLMSVLWLVSGRPRTFGEFRMWTGSWLPSIKSKKLKQEEGRTEFASLTELMQYLIDEDKRLKEQKSELSTSVNDI